MDNASDMDLLRQYAERHSDTAFAALVSRYVNLVYSAALRKTGNSAAADLARGPVCARADSTASVSER